MVITYLLFAFGLFLLVKSADWIIDGASSLAKKFGVSNLIIGLTVVAFGTSLPELVVNVFATLRGAGEVSFGNIVGSNIANILFVLGVTATIGSIKVKSSTVWKEIPFALLSAFVLFVLIFNKDFFYWNDGAILLGLFVLFLYYAFDSIKKNKKQAKLYEKVDEGNLLMTLQLVFGLIGVYFGGKWVVEGAVVIAGILGLSEFFISATVIAIGTSLPELVVCIMAVLKNNSDLAVGNIVGSNIFNVLWVFGIIPFISPIEIPAFVVFDVGVMFLATLLLFIFVFIDKKGEVSRTEGIVSLLFYALYIWFMVARG